jgi:hypothetical protein
MYLKAILLIISFAWLTGLYAQDEPEILKRKLEATAETNGLDETGIKELQEDLDHFRKHPINLNKATPEEFRKLHILTDLQIDAFIRYRKELGNLISIYELQSVPGWDLITIDAILPYVSIDNNSSLIDKQYKKTQSLKFDIYRILEKSKGYDTSLKNHYLGDSFGLLLTYSNRFSKSLQFGFTASKDPGEPFLKAPNNTGFDFYSFRLQIQNLGVIKNLVVGDYTVSLGQGLIYWQSLSFSKYADITSIKKQGEIIGAYQSANEFNFKRGVAVTVQKNNFEFSSFLSFKRISGHVNSDTADFFTSLLTNGYHRTLSEINQKNNVSLFSVGGNISFHKGYFNLGLNTAFDYFSKPFIKSAAPYNYYAFSGKKLFNNSISYSYTYYNMHVFGEFAIDKDFHKAIVQGILLSLSKTVDFSLLYRNLPPQYQSVFGKAYTENSQPSNESGLNTGIVVKPFHNLKISANVDYYQSPWLKYRVDAPSNGSNYLVQMQYVPSQKFEFIINYKNKSTYLNTPDSNTNYLIVARSEHWIIGSNWKLCKETALKFQLEFMNNIQDTSFSKGFLLYLEVRKRLNRKFQVDGRVQYIGSPGSTIYSYYNTYSASSLSALKGTGYNYYIILKYEPFKAIGIRVLFNKTIYKDRNSIGSGTDLIPGNKRSEVHLQIHYYI